ncbi:MAG: hypothetical protein ACK53A_02730 [Gemmatimonadota bacterium]|jgi:hypothetical protein|nr:hypothetical protein [Gemmatimonadota bacterium]
MPRRPLLPLLGLVLAACTRGPDADAARRDDPAATRELALADQLAAQKDSLTRIVLETDRFLVAIDSQLDRVPSLRTGPRPQLAPESPVADQLQQREELLTRVQQLVNRTRASARQLAEARTENKQLQAELARRTAESDSLVGELGATIERQLGTIQGLQSRVDSLGLVARRLEADTTDLRREVRGMTDAQARAWVIIGTERELLDRGVIVREGGTNLVVTRVGRTLAPARTLPREAFAPIDIRSATTIELPDTTRRYEIVSRHSLEFVEPSARDGNGVRRALRIADPAAFWAASRWLILVQR